MEGLVTEARKHALQADFGDDDVRDAAIITQYQRLTITRSRAMAACAALPTVWIWMPMAAFCRNAWRAPATATST